MRNPSTHARNGAQEGGIGALWAETPAVLMRSAVYKRLPLKLRSKVESALLLRPPKENTLRAIDAKYKLSSKYGISPAALRSYARKAEEVARPMVAGCLVAGILGCLPAAYRRRVLAGSEVLLLSRVVNSLSVSDGTALPVAELARLATVLAAIGRRNRAAGGPAQPDEKTAHGQGDRMAEAVRTLYGLSWPPEKPPAATPDLPQAS